MKARVSSSRHGEARVEHALFRRQHVEIGRQAVLVALPGEAVGLFEIGQRAARLREPRDEHLLARHGVGSFAQRLDDLAIVEGDGLVILTAATAVLALERAAVEQGEAYRGADASKAGAAGEQIAEPEGRQPDQRGQIDVGIESGACASLMRSAAPSTRARAGGDVGAAADQLDRRVGRNALRLQRADRRASDRQRAVGTVADQRGERVPGQRDRFVGRFEVGAGLRRCGLRPASARPAYRGRCATRWATSFAVSVRMSSADSRLSRWA